ncbi:hypothetical protein [Nocardioides sp. Kera G14]|uniref:hypothetical protein n=1 Tax=Nocardioides sp. Kera G14 TaxID=2884264 RepID=UPI001D128274|nr:hypothetical protein [Nocardioides sp. Kera G14]UDY23858.1 hypothetical protein LH076_00745 [Nocardioides sp. Kera G14]
MASLTRGSLPASVYWRRRAAVLGVLLLLFIGFTRMFGGSDDSDAAARNASATTRTPTSVVPENVGAPTGTPAASPSASPAAAAPVTSPAALPTPSAVLPTPTGRCSDDDVSVSATVGKAEATKRVYFALSVKTNVQAACLWQIGPKAVQVQVTSGSDRIWTTLDCPKAVPTQELTLRRDTPVVVAVKWNSRRSDDTCSDHTQWALPGYYHVQVAALGGEPTDIQFHLTKPVPVAPTPKATATASATPVKPAAPSASATATLGPGGQPTTTKKNPKRKSTRSEPTGSPVVSD